MTNLTPERRAELRQLLAESTPGPWSPAGVDDCEIWTDAEAETGHFVMEFDGDGIDVRGSDVAAMCAAVNALPALLDAADERDRLAAQVERVRALHVADGEGFCRCCDYMTPHPCETNRALDGADEARANLPITEDADGLTCDICGAELADWAAADHHNDKEHTP